MNLLNFNIWSKVRNIQHASGMSINEQESKRTPEGMDPTEVEAMEKRVKQRVKYAIANIVKTHPFFAGAATKLKYVYTYKVNTAAVDGTHMFINPMFFDPMNGKAIEFVIMHEIMHCMLQHFLRMDSRNRLKWNYATDYEINLIVARELGYDMKSDPVLKDGLYDENYKGMSAEHIYNSIPNPEQDKQQGQGGGQGQPGEDQGQGQGGGQGQPGEDQGQGQTGGGSAIDEVLTPEEGRKIAEEEGVTPGTPITKDDWNKILKDAAKERVRSRGGKQGTGGPLDALVDEILKPTVNWRRLLKKYIGAAAYREEYRVPSKRYIHSGEIRSGVWSSMEALTEVVIAMDTSGSMLQYIPGVFSELAAILQADKIKELTAIYFDTQVTSTEKLTQGKSPDPKAVKGGGGTLFTPVVEWVNKNMRQAELVVIMSDGDNFDNMQLTSMRKPKWAKNCIWIIIGNPTWEPPFGKVVHVPHDEFVDR
jgi:predicted metal-dependent peptidase